MSRYAIINDSIVDNIILCADDETAILLFPDSTVINIDKIDVDILWLYGRGEFTPPPDITPPGNQAS